MLLLRASVGGVLLAQGVLALAHGGGASWGAALAGVAILDGVALVTGSFTPAAAVLGACVVLARIAAPAWVPDGIGAGAAGGLVLVMAVAVSMLGPGAYSVDARLFGRREIEVPRGEQGAMRDGR